VAGLRVVLTPDEPREPAGLLSRLYECTHLARDYRSAAARLARVLELEAEHFAPIRSDRYGYEGLLTLFDPGRLDRIETVTPFDPAKTMGRFFARQGPCLYMAYAEARDLRPLRERLLEHASDDWSTPGAPGDVPDNLFVHPRALGGLLLGVSRESVAWTWSGRPERVQPAP
jgi:hypothetical protein